MKYRTIIIGAAVLMPLLAPAFNTHHCYLRDAASPSASTACPLRGQGLVSGATYLRRQPDRP
jgi:hypothetical protein